MLPRCFAVSAALLLLGTACLPSFPAASQSQSAAPIAQRSSAGLRIGKAIRGDLSGVLTFTATLKAKGEIAVIPRVTARLNELHVDLGARVRAGEALGELDRADLERQVQSAQAAQAGAEAKLAELKAGPRPEAVNQAQANLKAAQARLSALQAATGAAAGADPTAAQQRVDQARANLDRLQQGTPPDQAAADRADAAVNAAQTRLNQLQADPARANDRAALDAARQELQRAQDAANAAHQPTPSSPAAIAQAQQELQNATQAQLLLRLSPTSFELDQARALVDVADSEVKLVSAPATDDQIQAAQSEAEQAFAQAELARSRLADATVSAPVDGVVTEINATVGSTVGPTARLLTLIPPQLVASVDVDQSQVGQVQNGQTVALSVDGFPQDAFSGVVKGVAPVLDPRTRTAAVQVEVPDPQGKLRPGMFTQLAIQTGQKQGTLMVPREAVLRLTDALATAPPQNVVFLVVDNRVRKQRVSLGASDSRNVEVLDGLTEGVDLVLNPRPDLIDGELISGGS